MNLSVGIVGLPNVGKSTLFNALLKKQVANAANFPFTTIEPNVGVVDVPDDRLDVLADVVEKSEGLLENFKIIPAIVKFVDIAGLVKGAHKGEILDFGELEKIKDLALLSAKKFIVVLNSDEADLNKEVSVDGAIRICAKLEEEFAELAEDEQRAYSKELGIGESGLEKLIKKAYEVLGLATFLISFSSP